VPLALQVSPDSKEDKEHKVLLAGKELKEE
jgi:hypothetical protein